MLSVVPPSYTNTPKDDSGGHPLEVRCPAESAWGSWSESHSCSQPRAGMCLFLHLLRSRARVLLGNLSQRHLKHTNS
jgi:hypothetical protein